MKIGLIVPMALEAKYYRQHFHWINEEMFGSTKFEHFSINGNDLYLGLSGIGKVQAAMNLTSLLTKEKLDLVIMTGTAASMNADVHRLDLVVPDSFAYYDVHATAAGDYVEGQIPHEPARFELNSKANKDFAKFLEKENIAHKSGLVVTGDSFISSKEQKDAILKNFPDAQAVEMEGAAFAQVAYHFNTPLIAMRSISDNGDDDANFSFDEFAAEAGQRAAKVVTKYLEDHLLRKNV